MTALEELPQVGLAELLDTHDIVSVHKGEGSAGSDFMVVTPKALSSSSLDVTVPMREIGSASPSPFTSWIRQEYNFDLQGLNGLRIYDKMRRNDGTVRGTLRLVKTPVLAANWYVEPAGDKAIDQVKADFVWKNLTQWMSISWSQFLTESLLCLDFGYYMFEKVFDWGENVTSDPAAKGKIVWKKFAPRHPMDVKMWFFDENGGPAMVELWPQNIFASTVMGGVVNHDNGGTGNAFYDVQIPIEKLLVFTFDKEAGNIEGVSVLRSAYKHWYYKDNLYKIDAIQKERHGIGIPIIKLPLNFTDDDRVLADELGRNLRTNERAHVVLPPNWAIEFAQFTGRQAVNAIASIEHHDEQIAKNVLATFLGSGQSTKEEDQSLFLKGTRFIADVVLDTINNHAIPQLIDYNWGRHGNGYPRLRARRIGEQADWRTMSFAVRNYVGAGIIRPDDKLEAAIRDEMGLPPIDEATIRQAATPQQPGGPPAPGGAPDPNAPQPPKPPKAGPPRQGPPSSKPPQGNGGRDKSGG